MKIRPIPKQICRISVNTTTAAEMLKSAYEIIVYAAPSYCKDNYMRKMVIYCFVYRYTLRNVAALMTCHKSNINIKKLQYHYF